jgi:hypothetical protein
MAPGNFGIFTFVGNHPTAFLHAAEHIVVGLLMRDFAPTLQRLTKVTENAKLGYWNPSLSASISIHGWAGEEFLRCCRR